MKIETIKIELINIFDKLKYVIEFVISIVLIYYIRKILILSEYSEHLKYKYIIFVVLFSILFLCVLIIAIYNDRKRIEKMFLAFMIPIGILCLIFMLPGSSYDELEHLYRAYNVSKGSFVPETYESVDCAITLVPNDFILNSRGEIDKYKKLEEAIKDSTDYNEERPVFNSAQGYSPTLYIIPAILLNLGRNLNINILLVISIARICDFILFLILGYYSIKLIPFGKLIMLTYLFNPMVVNQAVSISADCLINSITLFFIAYAIKLIKDKEPMRIKNKIVLAITMILVALAKYVYFPLIFIILILLFKKGKIRKRDKIFIISICIICLILAIGWYIISSRYVDIRGYLRENGVNSKEQIKFIITHPFKYLITLLNTMYIYGEYLFECFFGYRLGFLPIFTNIPCIFLYAILLVLSIILEKNNEEFNKISRIVIIADFILTFILIFTGLYLIWTGVGANLIEGLQGRYFIPVMILPLLCCVRKDKYIKYKQEKVYILYGILLLVINIQALIPIIQESL